MQGAGVGNHHDGQGGRRSSGRDEVWRAEPAGHECSDAGEGLHGAGQQPLRGRQGAGAVVLLESRDC